MGMFDYVYYKCPECEKIVEKQSKSGDCNLSRFFIGDIAYQLPDIDNEHGYDEEYTPAPLEVLAEAQRDGLVCDKCNHHTKLVLGVPSVVFMRYQDE